MHVPHGVMGCEAVKEQDLSFASSWIVGSFICSVPEDFVNTQMTEKVKSIHLGVEMLKIFLHSQRQPLTVPCMEVVWQRQSVSEYIMG